MNTFDLDDPTITAYVLGELNPTEQAAFDARLASDAQLRAAVEEIRATASLVRAGYSAEPVVALTEQQRLAVQRPPRSAGPLAFRTRMLWMSSGLAAAACLILGVVLTAAHFSRQANSGVAIEQHEEEGATMHFGIAATTGSPADEKDSVRKKVDEQLILEKAATPRDAVAGPSALAGIDDRSVGSDTQLHAYLGDAGQNLQPSVPLPASPPGARGLRPEIVPSIALPPPAVSPAPPPAPRAAGDAWGSGGGRPLTAGRAMKTSESSSDAPAQAKEDALVRNRSLREPVRQLGAAATPSLEKNIGAENENYPRLVENEFLNAAENPVSTFSSDVDTASYANVRRFLNDGQLPPKDAVRIEEMINSFAYRYEPPSGDVPFSANIEVSAAPWNPEHRLVRIGLRGRDVKPDMRPPTSLVFLIDVSGSMNEPKKLPLVKQCLRLLVDQLNSDDRLAIVTYAGNAGLVMDSIYCTGENRRKIQDTINGLSAGGSTNGAGGIQMAYNVATQHHIKGGINRVILCTDGDFNVGASSESDLVRLIEDKRASGVYLSVLGFGSGNLQDAKMKMLSIHGNGNYAYIDSPEHGKKTLVDQMCGTLVTIAKDVKFQVEFNPSKVGMYRLIGYEQRLMAAQDFNDDRKDAGEIGAGLTMTALYEIVPPGHDAAVPTAPAMDDLKYQRRVAADDASSDEMLTVKIRYKEPDGDTSRKLEFAVKDAGAGLDKASNDFKFAAAVAGFGMVLRDSPFKGRATFDSMADLAQSAIDLEHAKARAEMVELIGQAKQLAELPAAAPKPQ